MKILAAVDLSKASGYVIEAVHRVATVTDGEVFLMHVVMTLPVIAGPEFVPVIEPNEVAERYLDEQDELADLVTQLSDADINTTAVLRQGDPVATVLKEAAAIDADLIVVGSHGHGLFFDAIVGSFSSGVLRESTIPVLVVPVKGLV